MIAIVAVHAVAVVTAATAAAADVTAARKGGAEQLYSLCQENSGQYHRGTRALLVVRNECPSCTETKTACMRDNIGLNKTGPP